MKIVLDLDDFSDQDRCEKELIVLNDYFDNFKITMFTIPNKTSLYVMDSGREMGCEFQPHGFDHGYLEMDCMPYHEAVRNLDRFVNPLREMGYLGRVFKAPYWRYSPESYFALKDNGYIIAVSREQVNPPIGLPIYEYDFELDEPWYEADAEILRLHGHCTKYRNDLATWYKDLIQRLPRNTEFLTVEEYVKSDW